MDKSGSSKSTQPSYNDKRVTTNLSHLIEPIIRHRILDSIFYKQYLYLTNESTILPIITGHVHYLAGADAIGRPSPFICCLLRLLELEPSEEIVLVCLRQTGFKYLSAMMLMYIRFAFAQNPDNTKVYSILEDYYSDYRKLRFQLKYPEARDGKQVRYRIGFMDDWVNQLLTQERVLDLIMPRIKSRLALEDAGDLDVRRFDTGDSDDGDGEEDVEGKGAEEDGNESSDYESDSD